MNQTLIITHKRRPFPIAQLNSIVVVVGDVGGGVVVVIGGVIGGGVVVVVPRWYC